MNLRPAAISAVFAAVLSAGCVAPLSNTLPNMPVFNTGASATIISPGQAAPPMTGYYPQNPFSTPSANPNGTPQPGQPVPVPTGAGPDMAMLGGATTIDTRQIRTRQDPLWDNPLFWPFAAVLWPFEKLGQAIVPSPGTSSGSYSGSGAPQSATQAPPGVTIPAKQQVEAAHEQAEIQAMQRQLAQRRAGGGAETQTASASTGSDSSLSIADELAAMRSRVPPPGTTPAATPSARPAPAQPDGAASASEWTTLKAEDRDRDGRTDRWVQQSRSGRKRELLDDDHDGRPEKTIYYEQGSDKIARIEEDTNGDGQPDSWTIYKDGQIVSRRADTNGDGEVDTWTFYRDGQVARQEFDTDGDGVRDRVDFYENGKLVRRTEDKDGDGHPERITLFDAKGNPVELDEDKNGDGKIDVRSYYTGGKLVRRELLDDSQAVQ